jgi:hypothetical protein
MCKEMMGEMFMHYTPMTEENEGVAHKRIINFVKLI